MRYLYTLLAACLLPFLALSQSNFKPGYAVSLNGDTLKGYIDYREWLNTPKTIRFKADINGPEKKLSAADTKYFNVNNWESYGRYVGKISLDKNDEFFMLNERDTTFRHDTVFVKILQQGPNMSLYSFSDRIKTRFYYSDKDSPEPQELVYRLYYDSNVVTMNKGRTVNESTYMKQLYNLAIKYNVLDDKLQRMIEELRYHKYYILKVVNKINGIKK